MALPGAHATATRAPGEPATLLDGLGAEIDRRGGSFTMPYTTVVTYAGRYSTSGRPGPP